MNPKTILTHLADDDQKTMRLQVALMLAKRFKARLSFLYCMNPVCMPIAVEGRAASAAFLAYTQDAQGSHEDITKVEAEKLCKEANILCDWSAEKGNHLQLLSDHSILKDLVIVSQDSSQRKDMQVLVEITDELPLLASCPVLVLPGQKVPQTLGASVVMGWKWKSESFRALRDALPFLTTAEKVVVGIFSDHDDPSEDQAILDYLKAHGVTASVVRNAEGIKDPAKGLLSLCQKEKADLLVMGAYGHSRLREIIFGGVTRQILEKSEIPLLMSH